MPELPEVETVARILAGQIAGRRITGVKLLRKTCVGGSPCPPECLLGRRILRVWRRGKFVRIDLDGGYGMAIHLRMTGWLGVVKAAGLKTARDAYVRMQWALDGGVAQPPPAGRTGEGACATKAGRCTEYLLFRDIRAFGRVWCGPLESIEKEKALARLGPEPLVIGAAEFARRLRARTGRLKSILLNQEFLAGVGNIYADEALFAARLHPLAKAARISERRAQALHAAIQKVLRRAIKAGGTTVDNFLSPDGRTGSFQRKLLAYGRAGEPCVRCRTPIQRIVVGQRGTWFCPRCQKKR